MSVDWTAIYLVEHTFVAKIGRVNHYQNVRKIQKLKVRNGLSEVDVDYEGVFIILANSCCFSW